MREACKGVSTVFHLASVVDSSMFPDNKKMEHVNVGGKYITRGVPEGKIKVRRGWVWEGVSPSHTLGKKIKI